MFDDIASTGTLSLELLYYWLKKMGQASFVFIDEFDAFYHFKLAFEVCKQLFNLDCQVFTSSHNTYLMTNDLLRPDCNFILQDNKIKPLQACTEKELRFGHNIEKIYRAGAFYVE
jgi:AAA15 family ATPase/GTPase